MNSTKHTKEFIEGEENFDDEDVDVVTQKAKDPLILIGDILTIKEEIITLIFKEGKIGKCF